MSLTNISCSFCKNWLASLSDIFPEITLCRIACSKTSTWDTPERCQNGRNDNIPITSTLNNMWLRVITILNWVWIVSANHHWLQEVYLYGDSTSTGKFASKQTYLWKWRMIIAVNFPRLCLKYIPPGSERLFLSALASCLALTSAALLAERLKSITSIVTGWFDLSLGVT